MGAKFTGMIVGTLVALAAVAQPASAQVTPLPDCSDPQVQAALRQAAPYITEARQQYLQLRQLAATAPPDQRATYQSAADAMDRTAKVGTGYTFLQLLALVDACGGQASQPARPSRSLSPLPAGRPPSPSSSSPSRTPTGTGPIVTFKPTGWAYGQGCGALRGGGICDSMDGLFDYLDFLNGNVQTIVWPWGSPGVPSTPPSQPPLPVINVRPSGQLGTSPMFEPADRGFGRGCGLLRGGGICDSMDGLFDYLDSLNGGG